MNVPVFTEWFIAMAASKSCTDRPGFMWDTVGIVTRSLCKLSWMRLRLLHSVILTNKGAFAFVGSFLA